MYVYRPTHIYIYAAVPVNVYTCTAFFVPVGVFGGELLLGTAYRVVWVELLKYVHGLIIYMYVGV